jgi:hypothetical protein
MADHRRPTQITTWAAHVTQALAEARLDAETECAYHRLVNTMLILGGTIPDDPLLLRETMGVGPQKWSRVLGRMVLLRLIYV